MKKHRILSLVALALLLVGARILYSNPESVSYSQSSTSTVIANSPYDLRNHPTATVTLHFGENYAEVGPGVYRCNAWISLSVSTTGGASYSRSSEGSAWTRAYLAGLGGASARGAYTASSSAVVAAPGGATAIAGVQAGNVVHVTITSCERFPCSVTATYSGGGSCTRDSAGGGSGGDSPGATVFVQIFVPRWLGGRSVHVDVDVGGETYTLGNGSQLQFDAGKRYTISVDDAVGPRVFEPLACTDSSSYGGSPSITYGDKGFRHSLVHYVEFRASVPWYYTGRAYTNVTCTVSGWAESRNLTLEWGWWRDTSLRRGVRSYTFTARGDSLHLYVEYERDWRRRDSYVDFYQSYHYNASVPLKEVRLVAGNGTLLARGSTSVSHILGGGTYYLQLWYVEPPKATPILPGVLLLPNLSAGFHTVAGGFVAVLVNGSGGGLRLWRAALPVNVSVARGFSWRMLRDPHTGFEHVDVSNYILLPRVRAANTSGYLLALESPTVLGPARLCVDSNCTWYNVTRLVLSVEGELFNGTHLIVRLKPGYECCPQTPIKEHLVYALQLGTLTIESPRDAPVVAVPLSQLSRLSPGPLKATLYARYSPGGKVPLQLVNAAILGGSVKLLAARGPTLVFSRPYVWPIHYARFQPQPWNGSPGTLWVRVGDTPWTTAAWNGTSFVYTYNGSLDGATIEFLWIPPENASQLVVPLLQKWVLGRW